MQRRRKSNKQLYRPIISFFIIIFFTATIILPHSLSSTSLDTSLYQSTILYVGGSGPGNYSTIQQAINDANHGDVIFVFSGIYHENIAIDHSIKLFGEEQQDTYIIGDKNGDVVFISASWVTISGFTIQQSGSSWSDAGIQLESAKNTLIKEVTITQNNYGIHITSYSTYNILKDCIISQNHAAGIHISDESNQNSIMRCTITQNNESGIEIGDVSQNNLVTRNIISWNNNTGIWLFDTADSNCISENVIEHNGNGIYIFNALTNRIQDNNFIENNNHAGFGYYLGCIQSENEWISNYWDDCYVSFLKVIQGLIYSPEPFVLFPWMNVDWSPAYHQHSFQRPSSEQGKWWFSMDSPTENVAEIKEYKTGAIPTIIIVDVFGNIAQTLIGIQSKEDLINALEYAEYSSFERALAPNFTLTAIYGYEFILSECRGTPVILNFMALYCGPCYTQVQELHELQKELEDNVVILSIDILGANGYETEEEVIDEFGEYIRES